uniref:Uncharacterized protein n=1 Tax=Oryza sativa subsp. japonica TaxID=39947 RepID=Q6K6R9_ORYSJ|nr:hypothetical protein [Oryza sativa Japonica Group]
MACVISGVGRKCRSEGAEAVRYVKAWKSMSRWCRRVRRGPAPARRRQVPAKGRRRCSCVGEAAPVGIGILTGGKPTAAAARRSHRRNPARRRAVVSKRPAQVSGGVFGGGTEETMRRRGLLGSVAGGGAAAETALGAGRWRARAGNE